ncbi:L-glutaminase [Loktanella fryxellensis]|uniref:Glutaminase n=1 Tax=Loktanella fryxellensis TaxID=245187 RepID=A0A1H7Z9K2_9RHOB|nr:glutaminase [Loktanella fryxellensis]SEM54167.1 L-glutaminase [Loktanella fryxellensis]
MTLDLTAILDEIGAEMAAATDRGKVASYIPELACIDPARFGMAVCLPDGQVFTTGDAQEPFSIQSISKVFTLAMALGRMGDQFWDRVSREPSGQAFNSILQLEHHKGIPRNPFVNAGAIATTDAALAGHAPSEFLGELLQFIRTAAGDDSIFINEKVAKSEEATGDLNRALAYFMAAHGNMANPVPLALGAYFHQCAVEMSCAQLARAALFLTELPDGPRLVSAARRRRINAMMMLCGHYDASGDFAYRVGLPGKSGVGGGIMVVAPQHAGIAVWSPGLNGQGNSKLGTAAVEMLVRATGWSVFD